MNEIPNIREWQVIEIPKSTRLLSGSTVDNFNKLKILILNDYAFVNKIKVNLKISKLETANGYWNLDGREIEVIYKKQSIMKIHVEDCGLGLAKAYAFLNMMGMKLF